MKVGRYVVASVFSNLCQFSGICHSLTNGFSKYRQLIVYANKALKSVLNNVIYRKRAIDPTVYTFLDNARTSLFVSC